MATGDPILVALQKLEASLSQSLSGQIHALRLEMSARFDAIEVRLERLHTPPREELLAKLRALTNLRVALDPGSATAYKVEPGPLPAWTTPINEEAPSAESESRAPRPAPPG